MNDQELMEAVKILMQQDIAPALAAHGGGADVKRVENGAVYVELQGGCKGCPGARMTMKNGIEEFLKERLPEVKTVIDVTDHGTGA